MKGSSIKERIVGKELKGYKVRGVIQKLEKKTRIKKQCVDMMI